jgi:putative ABC transport system permease protein
VLTRDRLGAFVAVLLGTAIVTAALSLFASGAPQVPDRFAAAVAAVQSPSAQTPADPFPETRPWSSAEAAALAGRLGLVPGVTAAVADRSFYAQPAPGGKPLDAVQEGHGWASAALAADRLTAGRAPESDREVVVDRSLKIPIGGPVTVLTATGPSEWTVTGLVAAPRLYVADRVAARLAPGVRVIGLVGRPDRAALRQAAGGATLLTGDDLGALEPRADARTRWIGMQVLTAMAALSAFSCIFVIASTFAFSVHQRRRELGLLRAVGATPRQVRRILLREALVVGTIAAAAGVALGALITPFLDGVLVDAGLEPPTYAAGVQLWPIAAGFAAGPVVAVAGATAAAFRAARVGPLEALRLAEVEERPMTRWRWVAGLVFAAAGGAAGLAAAVTDDRTELGTYALLGAMALIVAATLLAPAVVPRLVRIALWPIRGVVGMVVRGSVLTGVRRTASTAAPVLLTIAFAVFIAGNVQTSTDAYAARRAGSVQAGAVLTPDGTPGLSDAAVAAVSGAALLPTNAYVNGTAASAVGVEPAMVATAVPALAGSVRNLAGPDTVVITKSRAAQLGRGPGQTVAVTFADGIEVPLRIVGVAPDGSVPAELILDRAAVRTRDPSALSSAVLLLGAATPSPAIGARVVDVATFAEEADAQEDRLVWIATLLLIAVSVGYGAITVANTLVMATTKRAGDFRQLRLAGATRRQVLLAVAAESTVVVAIGSILGGGIALLALWGGTAGLSGQTGRPVSLAMPWPTVATTVAVCLTLALLASVLPARAKAGVRATRSGR